MASILLSQNIQMLKILICSLLLLSVTCVSWQGAGNFTDSNFTDIKNILSGVSTKLGLEKIDSWAKIISDELNARWDPAWNVIVTKLQDKISNGVVFGYAYNGHWLWYNNYQDSSISFIIWKDYNCQVWTDYDMATTIGSFLEPINSNMMLGVATLYESKPEFYDDIWQGAYFMATTFDSKFSLNLALSVVVIQNADKVIGRFCGASLGPKTPFLSMTKGRANSNFGIHILIIGMRKTA